MGKKLPPQNVASCLNAKLVRHCEQCGESITAYEFELHRGRGRFCSQPCVHANRLKIASQPARIAERFWRHVDKNGPVVRPELGPCWLWTASKKHTGYGEIKLPWKKEYAHRVAFFIEHGRWPEPQTLHHCDNRACVRASHLSEGSCADNMRDMAAKGRSGPRNHPERMRRGEGNSSAKLTDATVRAIRAAYPSATLTQIATQFGVHYSTVHDVVQRKTWRHVEDVA